MFSFRVHFVNVAVKSSLFCRYGNQETHLFTIHVFDQLPSWWNT